MAYIVVSSPSATINRARQPRAGIDSTSITSKPFIVFRNTRQGPDYGLASLVPLSNLHAARLPTTILVDRLYMTLNGGLALRANRGSMTTYEAISFDETFRQKHSYKLAGAPSRTRVSKSGKFGASTVFVTGDSYNSGGFSTRTTIYDLKNGTVLGDLEEFKIERDGKPWKKSDFNFWGVTFAGDDDTFFATLFSGDMPYLIKGSMTHKVAAVIHDHIECPSLSPDGTQVAFKSRETLKGRRVWLLKILDLKTGIVSATSELRSVDDQPEWLDKSHVAYSLPHTTGAGSDIWSVDLSGERTPELIIPDAYSPCVVYP